jgi:uncharacterized SAM-binding protein YcdF (DUF218 family)
MFFLISKMVEFLTLPSNLIGVLGVMGIVALIGRRKRLGITCSAIAIALLAICGWTPVGPAAVMALEDRFPQPTINGPVAGVVLLGGAVDTHITGERHALALNAAGERITTALELSRRYPDARIFLSGGANHVMTDQSLTESQVAKTALVAMGLPEHRIEMEEHSRNTCENGTESAAALKPKPGEQWLLVTSASHMPRAVGCFRAAGFNVVPYPVDYRTQGGAELRWPVASIALGLEASDLAAHEWIGLVAYRWAGMTTDPFPTP